MINTAVSSQVPIISNTDYNNLLESVVDQVSAHIAPLHQTIVASEFSVPQSWTHLPFP